MFWPRDFRTQRANTAASCFFGWTSADAVPDLS
jgi:hypothetical protein